MTQSKSTEPTGETDIEPLEVGDIERHALVDIELNALPFEESQISVIEVLTPGEEPFMAVETHGDWGGVRALLTLEDARDIRDRMTEVIEVCEEADTGVEYEYLCDHCLRPVDPGEADTIGKEHYHPDCPHEPMTEEEAKAIINDDDLTELQERILEYYDEKDTDLLTVETAGVMLLEEGYDVTGDELTAAFEELQHRRIIDPEPVVYERVR